MKRSRRFAWFLIASAFGAGCTGRDATPRGEDVTAKPAHERPAVGPVVVQAEAPPPVSGRALLPVPGGRLLWPGGAGSAAAAARARDRLYLADLGTSPLRLVEVSLAHGDQPGRLVEDGAGRVHVVLRGAGAVATLDVDTAAL